MFFRRWRDSAKTASRVTVFLSIMLLILSSCTFVATSGPDVTSDDRGLDDATIWGFIKDTSGGPITGATVKLTSTSNVWLVYTATSMAGGYYTLELPAGEYSIQVSKQNYFPVTMNGEVHQGEIVQYDFDLAPIPPKNSVVKGKVFNNDTGIGLVFSVVILYDIVHNFSDFRVTDIFGNYEFKIYEGVFLLYVNATNFIPKIKGGVKLPKDGTVTVDFGLIDLPPIDARIEGYVKALDGNGIENVTVNMYDLVNSNYVQGITDSDGRYSVTTYAGPYLLLAQPPTETNLDAAHFNVTAVSGDTAMVNFSVGELRPSLGIVECDISNWTTLDLRIKVRNWGRDWPTYGLSMLSSRMMIDFFLGDGDLFLNETEVDMFMVSFVPLLKNEFSLHNTKDTVRVDDVDFIYEDELTSVDVVMAGSIFTDDPVVLTVCVQASANGTVDTSIPVHKVWLNQSYATPDSSSDIFVYINKDFLMRDEMVPVGFTLEEEAPTTLAITTPMDPDLNDDEWRAEITFDLVDKVPPIADGLINATVNEDDLVEFNASASFDNLGITYYVWEFGDGERSNITYPIATHKYKDPGNYTVNLTVIDKMGLKDAMSGWVRVLDVTPPVVDILLENTTLMEDIEYIFTANATDNLGIVGYRWTLDGEVLATTASLDHIFPEPGNYELMVEVTDESSLRSSDTVKVIVTDETPPMAVAVTDLTIDEDVATVFDASNSTDNVGIVSYTWDFGDGSILVEGMRTVHKFDVPGIYVVTLSVFDKAGHGDMLTVDVKVLDATPPEAELMLNDTSMRVRTRFLLNASGSVDNVGIVSYEWDFGDGNGAEGELVSHTYKRAGKYNITLTVTDAQGLSDSRSVLVNVHEPPAGGMDPMALLLILVIVFVAGIGSVLAYRRLRYGGYSINEVFIIYKDGRLIKHVTIGALDTVDKDILAGMLTAVQEFVKDSFKEKDGSLGKIEYGKKTRILIERGKRVYVALVLTGHDPETLRKKLTKAVKMIEVRYAKTLKDWEGDDTVFRGLERLVKEKVLK